MFTPLTFPAQPKISSSHGPASYLLLNNPLMKSSAFFKCLSKSSKTKENSTEYYHTEEHGDSCPFQSLSISLIIH